MTQPAWRTTYTPGTWLALTGPNTLVVMAPPPARAAATVNDLWRSVVEAGSLDALLKLVSDVGLDAMDDLGAFHWDADGLHGIARGSVQVVDTDTSDIVIDGQGSVTWREEHLGRQRNLGITLEPFDPVEALQLPLVVGAASVSALFLTTNPAALVRFPVADADPQAEPEAEPEAPAAVEAPIPAEAGPEVGQPAEQPTEQPEESEYGVVHAETANAAPRLDDIDGDAFDHPVPAPDGSDFDQPFGSQEDDDEEISFSAFDVDSFDDRTFDEPADSADEQQDPYQAQDEPEERRPEDDFGEDPRLEAPPADEFKPDPERREPSDEEIYSALAGVPSALPGVPPIAPEVGEQADEPMSLSSPAAERSDPVVIPPTFGEVEDDDGGTIFSTGLAATHKPAPPSEEHPDPQVLAVPCANGHANAPGSRTCRICQYPVDSSNPRLIRRPLLAGVHTNRGDFADIVTGVIVGRAPDPGKGPAGSYLMRVQSPGNDISRNHVLITTRDWNVYVTDLNSTNGTTVLPDGEPPFSLRDGASVKVGIGTVLDLGDGVSLRIEPPRG